MTLNLLIIISHSRHAFCLINRLKFNCALNYINYSYGVSRARRFLYNERKRNSKPRFSVFAQDASRNKVLPDTPDRAARFTISLRSHLSALKEASDCQRGYPLGDQQVLMASAIPPTGLLSFRSFTISAVTRRNLADL